MSKEQRQALLTQFHSKDCCLMPATTMLENNTAITQTSFQEKKG